MNILITGVHGFVGSNLVEYLKESHSIYGLDIIQPEKDGIVRTFSWDDFNKAYMSFPTASARLTGCLEALKEADKMISLEEKKIPENIDYEKVPNLASEARQKLKEVRPTTIAQAIRISGVNPADISILMVYLRKNGQNE